MYLPTLLLNSTGASALLSALSHKNIALSLPSLLVSGPSMADESISLSVRQKTLRYCSNGVNIEWTIKKDLHQSLQTTCINQRVWWKVHWEICSCVYSLHLLALCSCGKHPKCLTQVVGKGKNKSLSHTALSSERASGMCVVYKQVTVFAQMTKNIIGLTI